ncbi:MAG: hypothetical protein WCD38_01895, partial [Candidatus Tumulicola sp.]
MDLRPLGFGEIFDRAITLYVRNFWPFLAIVLVLIVPLAVIQYVLDSSQLAQFDQMIRVFTHPNAPQPALASLFSSPGEIAAIVAVALLYYALWPFVFVAVAFGVARLYGGRPVEFGACYRSVLPHWGAILLTQLVAVAVFVAWYVAFFIVLVAAGVVAALLARASIVLAIVAFVVLLLLALAFLLALALVFIALAFAMNAVAIENAGPMAAIASGFGRVFARKELGRALVFALAAFAVIFGGSMVVSAVALLALFAHA